MTVKGTKQPPHTKEHKRKISDSLRKTFAKQGGNNLGRKWFDKVNKKKGRFGKDNAMSRPEIKKKQLEACQTPERRLKMSLQNKGENNGNWKGGERLIYGSDWSWIRTRAKERDGNKCLDCRTDKQLVTHHIQPFDEGGTHDMENLKTLCRSCHMITHAQLKKGVVCE